MLLGRAFGPRTVALLRPQHARPIVFAPSRSPHFASCMSCSPPQDSVDDQGVVPDTPLPWKRRWTVVWLCAAAFLLCSLDRVNMSIAIIPMAQQYAWDNTTMGLVQSSFFWGYLVTQIAGGVLADRIGGKIVLGLGVVWWSLATMLTPLAASAGLVPLLAVRAMMGVGEGVALPAMNAIASSW